ASQNRTKARNVSSSSTWASTNCRRSSCFARSNANCRDIVSRVPILRARWSSSISHHSGGPNSWRMASATSVRVMVPSKSVKTARFADTAAAPVRPPKLRPFLPRIEVCPLFLRETIDSDPQAVQLQSGDFEIEILGDRVDARFQLCRMLGEVSRGDRLDRETHVHDLDRVALSRRDVHEPTFG